MTKTAFIDSLPPFADIHVVQNGAQVRVAGIRRPSKPFPKVASSQLGQFSNDCESAWSQAGCPNGNRFGRVNQCVKFLRECDHLTTLPATGIEDDPELLFQNQT